ncbi:MAG: glutamine cyclotransferase [Gemmatimonadota bacterium]|nr:MAG: glutamine cyclotransferase [Gemmatimonadota bacterium]
MNITRRAAVAAVAAACLGLAIGCGSGSREFDEAAAWQHLLDQVEMGPRVPGSQAHANALAYFRSHLETTADRVVVESFDGVCPLDSSSVTFHNVVATFRPESPRRILFGAHWDSRPFADQDEDPARRREPVLGANDGASGVAVLLEMATRFAERPPGIGVDLVLFDAEDCGREGEPDTWALGSQEFVRRNPSYRPAYAVILDMVGRDGMRLLREGNSVAAAPRLVSAIWAVAAEVGATAFTDSTGRPVWDDHVAFLEAGIPAVDIIDFEDPRWHTTADDVEHCSAESLGQVGRVALALVRKAEEAESP